MNKYMKLIPAYHMEGKKYVRMLEAVTDIFNQNGLTTDLLISSFDLDKAVGKQLDIIGEWVGRNRMIQTPIESYYFSFDIADLGFDSGIWKGRFDSDKSYIKLDDDNYRVVIKAKIGANNWDGTAESFNNILSFIHSNNGLSVSFEDNLDMSFTVTIKGKSISTITKEIIHQGYLSLKPMGITVNYHIVEG
ncbi:DUF2612 domain-containing protein [Photorhabdus noenieputensis]|uniref:DUF2612 domain-containing protein n=1 Tax=Photorhabdus noenieputensis TaxID=1208607 RepID=UPI001BD68F0A|nr:DUF2612 domain-containing protein [Photorhabdus noenieputensis]MBS9436900.1 DUF2612 domain-containing protein [Photorhabdus noenieputensis]MCK3667165.1 DUF2612 domain-containing protein [Photorhabdus noenieputensis]